MFNMGKASRSGLRTLSGVLTALVITTGCSLPGPSGAGDDECAWERERIKPTASTLTYVSLTITPRGVLTGKGGGGGSRPAPAPKPAKPNVVKPGKPGSVKTVKPKSKPVKPPQPSSPAGSGHYWQYDCD